MEAGDAGRLLKKLNIPISFNQIVPFGFVCGALTISTFILQEKRSGKKD